MEKALDRYGRWRNKVVAFRMSPEEDELLEAKVKLSGMTKQDYILNRLADKEIAVVGNPRVFKALKNQMGLILEELKRIEAAGEVTDEMLELIELITVTLGGMKGGDANE